MSEHRLVLLIVLSTIHGRWDLLDHSPDRGINRLVTELSYVMMLIPVYDCASVPIAIEPTFRTEYK